MFSTSTRRLSRGVAAVGVVAAMGFGLAACNDSKDEMKPASSTSNTPESSEVMEPAKPGMSEHSGMMTPTAPNMPEHSGMMEPAKPGMPEHSGMMEPAKPGMSEPHGMMRH